jgi:hypothetical protein
MFEAEVLDYYSSVGESVDNRGMTRWDCGMSYGTYAPPPSPQPPIVTN